MPMMDMPLEDLRVYGGISPKPLDFDNYWEDAVAEVEALGTSYETFDAAFTSPVAECRNLYYQGVGGSRIHAKAILPSKVSTPVPALLHFHGYSSSSAPWVDYLSFAASGIAVFAMDCRGQGGLSEDRFGAAGPTLYGNIVRGLEGSSKDLHYRAVFQDALQLARIVMARPDIDAGRVGAYGGSQGGGLTIACAALEPRILCLAPLYPFLADYRRIWDMDLGFKSYEGLRNYFRLFDPLHQREEEIFETLGYIDIANLAPRIAGRVFFGATLMDDICPPSTQFAVYNRLTVDKEMVLYPDFKHERIPDFIDRMYQFLIRELG